MSKTRRADSHLNLPRFKGNIDAEETDAPCWSMPGGLAIGESEDVTASCCCHKNNEPLDETAGADTSDLAFLRQMAFYLVRDVPSLSDSRVTIDTKRIYMSGHGNGCMLANSMAAHHSDLVAAVACMAGVSITALSSDYVPVPTWTVAGSLDDIVPTSGSRLPSGKVLFPGQQASFQYLSDAHACTNVYNNSTSIHEMDLPEYPLAGTMHVQTSFGCSNGAVVQHVTLVTGGHLIYKGTEEMYPASAADTTVDTTSMAWGFMTSFASTHEPILEQKIDLDEIKDLLQGDEAEQDEAILLVPPPAQPQKDNEDDMQSPWRGLRGPGISEEQALVS
jgi:poly(3-hydroxybutyrate) depolymerase